MGVTKVNSKTFLSDIIIFLRDRLNNNIDDPNSTKRGTARFILTEYPQKTTLYPTITITDIGVEPGVKLGMRSEGEAVRVNIEIRIWARNVKERDDLFNKIYDFLRSNQHKNTIDEEYTSSDEGEMFDYRIDSIVNVSEEDVKSKVMEVSYLLINV